MRGVSNKHCLLTFFIYSETTRPIELKFHMKTPYDRLAKIYTNCTCHMFKMATMPIYGKNPLNILFSATKRPMALGCIIGDVGPTRFAQMMNLGDLDLLYGKVKFDS